jgi:hypothetical protein
MALDDLDSAIKQGKEEGWILLEMDYTAIRSALSESKGLASLQLQNHLYGCFIIMEDIANGVLTYSNGILKGSNFTIDLNTKFSMIGLRYGFVMDTQLILSHPNPLYQSTWLSCFQNMSVKKDLSSVDAIEDQIITILKEVVPSEESFFLHSLESGSLPQEWVEKMLALLLPNDEHTSHTSDASDETPSKLVQALTEKPIKKRTLSLTRRRKEEPKKKQLGLTRRSHKA